MTADVEEAEVAQGQDARKSGPRGSWQGLVDYYGFHTGSGAWFFVGWIEAL